MKLKSFLCLLLFVCTVVSCYEPDDGDYIAPITLYESIGGRWSLSGITMTDELAVATNISPSKQNLGVYFNYQDFVLDLNVNGDNRPMIIRCTAMSRHFFRRPDTGDSIVIFS